MTDRSAEIFIQVCREGNMTQAAEMLYISQPAVSKTIAELENEFQVKLFTRNGNKLALTTAGKRLLNLAKRQVEFSAYVLQEMSRYDHEVKIRLGATLTVGTYLLLPLVKEYQQMKPNTEIELFFDNTTPIENMLVAEKIDLAIVEGDLLPKTKNVVIERLIRDEMVFVCAQYSKLDPELEQENPVMTLEKLSEFPLFCRSEVALSYKLTKREFEKAGLTCKAKGQFNSIDAIKKAVACDLGIACISENAILPSDKLKRITVPDFRLTRYIKLVRSELEQPDSVREFADFLAERIRGRSKEKKRF